MVKDEVSVITIPHENIIRAKGYALDAGPIEVREHRDGTYSVWYLEEGYVPCPVNCTEQLIDRRHKCDRTRPYTQGSFGVRGVSAPDPDVSYEAAVEHARYLSDGREIRVIHQGSEIEMIS